MLKRILTVVEIDFNSCWNETKSRLLDTEKRFKKRFCIGWIPLGAYVRFGSSDGDDNNRSVLPPDLHPLKRVMISIAGALTNLLVAYICIFSARKQILLFLQSHPTTWGHYPTARDQYPTARDHYPTAWDDFSLRWTTICVLSTVMISLRGNIQLACWRWQNDDTHSMNLRGGCFANIINQ